MSPILYRDVDGHLLHSSSFQTSLPLMVNNLILLKSSHGIWTYDSAFGISCCINFDATLTHKALAVVVVLVPSHMQLEQILTKYGQAAKSPRVQVTNLEFSDTIEMRFYVIATAFAAPLSNISEDGGNQNGKITTALMPASNASITAIALDTPTSTQSLANSSSSTVSTETAKKGFPLTLVLPPNPTLKTATADFSTITGFPTPSASLIASIEMTTTIGEERMGKLSKPTAARRATKGSKSTPTHGLGMQPHGIETSVTTVKSTTILAEPTPVAVTANEPPAKLASSANPNLDESAQLTLKDVRYHDMKLNTENCIPIKISSASFGDNPVPCDLTKIPEELRPKSGTSELSPMPDGLNQNNTIPSQTSDTNSLANGGGDVLIGGLGKGAQKGR